MAAHAGVTWEQQAERLQLVNASLLESWQFGEYPLDDTRYITTKSVISLLPEINTTVGGKTEKSVAPTFHGLPTLEANYRFSKSIVGHAWVGYLPSGLESIANMDGTFSQSLYGAGITYTRGRNWFFPLSFQWTKADYDGNISSSTSTVIDSFSIDAFMYSAGVGYFFEKYNIWTNFLVGRKINKSIYKIQEDQTTVSLRDTMSDSTLGMTYQASIGYRGKRWQFAIGELYQPNRILISKFLVSYAWVL